jgi:hypothetical protein
LSPIVGFKLFQFALNSLDGQCLAGNLGSSFLVLLLN